MAEQQQPDILPANSAFGTAPGTAQLGRLLSEMDPPDQGSLAEAQNSLAHPEIAQNTIMPAASKTSMPPPRAETRAKPSATQHQVGQPKAAGSQVQVVLLPPYSQELRPD